MPSYRYIRAAHVKAAAKERGKRCGADFLSELDRHVDDIIQRSADVFNGHKKTLDRAVLKHVIGR